MDDKQKYDEAFYESFGIEKNSSIEKLEYNSIPSWDSVGHMGLISALEEKFDIMMEMDDIIDFSSYDKGIDILKKHSIKILDYD